MTKREFLKELEDRLQMLDEKERKDMIEEYSQHISIIGGECPRRGTRRDSGPFFSGSSLLASIPRSATISCSSRSTPGKLCSTEL